MPMQKPSFHLLGSVGLLLSISFFSCSQKDTSDEVIKQLEESLKNSSTVINHSTETMMKELENKTTDHCTVERAKIWFEKAEQIIRLSKEVYDYLLSAKEHLIEKKQSPEFLNDSLISYQENVLSIDSSIREVFSENFNFIKGIQKSTVPSVLTATQNRIKIIENKMIAYCNSKVGCHIMIFDSYSAIVGQNSNSLKPGDVLEITAGIGAYNRAAQPEITINNKRIEINEDGYVLYKIKTTNKPGTYKIPVRLSYINPNTGKNEILEKKIEYIITKPCDQ